MPTFGDFEEQGRHCSHSSGLPGDGGTGAGASAPSACRPVPKVLPAANRRGGAEDHLVDLFLELVEEEGRDGGEVVDETDLVEIIRTAELSRTAGD